MKKHLLLGLLTLASAQFALAFYQWDIELSDLEQVACWNPESCSPTIATVDMHSTDLEENPLEYYTFNAEIHGPHGWPLVYSITLDVDDEIDCDLYNYIDTLYVSFDGPGFHYSRTRTYSFEGYYCTISLPRELSVPAGDGCIPFDPGLEWTFANFPDGQIALTENFTVQANEELFIEAGMEVYGLPGTSLTILGEMTAIGDADNWITFQGDNWEGLIFGNGSDAEMRYCKLTDVVSVDDGGAITVQSGGHPRLFNCLIAGNSCTGNGAAAYVADNGALSLSFCTVSDNVGTLTGGVYIGGGSALFESSMTLITFNEPVNTDVRGSGFTNVNFTNIYPQNSDFPQGMVLPVWYCDPGYVDAEGMDYNVSYWSLTDPTQTNCIIDVSVNELETDPDGTPGDMGAFPFDQHMVMLPATILTVADRADDQGGFVILSFLASPNDGSHLNPTTMYSVWVQYPGMPENQWVSAGTVAAIANPEMTYSVAVPTLDDQYEGHSNIHNFMVATHSVHFPIPMSSQVMQGFSLDNIAPTPVTGVANEDWAYDAWPPNFDLLPLSWNPNSANDFTEFVVKASLENDITEANTIYQGPGQEATYSIEYGTLQPNQLVYFWTIAYDEHGNISQPTPYEVAYENLTERAPMSFELGQNYPNPFNPSTSIAYALPVQGQVELSVFNMMGAKVITLVNETQPAGRYSVTFNAGELASGVYFYRLQTPSFTDMKKMILVK